MRTDNIKKFMVREIGHAILQASRHPDRKIVEAMMKHCHGFHLRFYKPAGMNLDDRSFFRFTFWTDAVDLPEVDTEFDYTLVISDDVYNQLKAVVIEAVSMLWYIDGDSTDSINDLLEREAGVVESISVGNDGYFSIAFSGSTSCTEESDAEFELEAYIPEDML